MSKQTGRSIIDPKRANSELFTLTYGALVVQLLKDHEDPAEINVQLDKMGYNIGLRLIDDFLSKNPNVGKCHDLRETADVLAKQGFRNYLGIVPLVTNWSPAADEFSLILDANPLTEFVELPADEDFSNLNYSQMICGAIRGALEMVHMEVKCWFVHDQLKGDSATELRVKFIRKIEESIPIGDD